ncbi:glycosyltransferase family 2 protein [Candidatus Woesearchaeota archaeon]|nr:MAG: glycosyltransferase family 2 protein [Candidatus Woesearchaeota archaeon]
MLRRGLADGSLLTSSWAAPCIALRRESSLQHSMILVASVTYDGEEYALDTMLDALKAQTHPDFDVLFVDNSASDWYQRRLEQALERRFPGRWTVLRARGEGRFGRILASRKAARDFVLENKYQSVLFVDSDVIIPPETLTTFLQSGAELATGVYLNVFSQQGSPRIQPCIFIDVNGKARRATLREVLENECLSIGAAGLGCTFVARRIIEACPFRLNARGAGEDILFYRDAVAQGAKPVALTSIRCLHMHFPAGDPRNKRFDAARYRL